LQLKKHFHASNFFLVFCCWEAQRKWL
jgi:hypothetical protein